MKGITILLCLLLAAPFILAHDDDEPPYDCKFKGPSSFYNLEPLYKNGGNAYSASDAQGNSYYFNFCGDLSEETESSVGCDANAAVCVATYFGSYLNAGRPSEEWVVGDDPNVVGITYVNGDTCKSALHATDTVTYYQTVLQLSCDSTAVLNITSVGYSDCQVTINATSQYACPKTGGRKAHQSSILVILLPALCCCCSCLCVVACCRRRRRMCKQQTELTSVSYQPVSQEIPQPVAQVQAPQPVAHTPQFSYPAQAQAPQVPLAYQPYVMPMQYQFQPQYFQPPSYFYPQQPTPVAPLEQANDSHIVNRDNQVSNDEQLAKELQAKFDREN